jgi:catechol-2,3-dioxygenase
VITKSIYFLDPDGNRLEIFTQQLPAATAKQTLHDFSSMGEALQPVDLETIGR